MSEQPKTADESGSTRSDARDELRTIGFRLREIQRLLGARVAQENRRLEAEGIDPVDGLRAFSTQEDKKVEEDR